MKEERQKISKVKSKKPTRNLAGGTRKGRDGNCQATEMNSRIASRKEQEKIWNAQFDVVRYISISNFREVIASAEMGLELFLPDFQIWDILSNKNRRCRLHSNIQERTIHLKMTIRKIRCGRRQYTEQAGSMKK
jgi:hypothetical protein